MGPLAEQTKVLLGNYNGHPARSVSILDGIYTEFGEGNVPSRREHLSGASHRACPRRAFSPLGGQAGLRVTYNFAVESGNKEAAGGKRLNPWIDGGIAHRFAEKLSLKNKPRQADLD